jgi:O-acetyl-ADP-ribose deacetylase (regulator of RNase III)
MPAELEILRGDITAVAVDAIVNAANNDLVLGSGVAGAIRTKGGPSIQRECDEIGPIPVGEAAITGAGNLLAKHVIHAASMSLGSRTTAESLVASVKNSLLRADERELHSIAFPAIGTGVAGFPVDDCARLMVQTIREHLDTGDSSLERIVFVLFDRPAYDAFERVLAG